MRHLEYEPWEAKGHPQRREHDGPIFGAFQVMGREWLSEPGQIALHVHGTPRTESAADLRQLALDALAAAEWIEAHK